MPKKIFFSLCLILMFFSFNKTAQAITPTTIKIGLYPLGSYNLNNTANQESNCHLDYLKQIANYNNWQYEFIHTPNLNVALNLLQNNKIDLISPVTLNLDLAKQFTYTSLPLGISYEILVTNQYTSLVYEDFEQFNNLKIGCLKPDFQNEKFFIYAQDHNFQPNLTYFYNLTDLRNGLKDGKVQAIIINALSLQKEDRILAEFGPAPFYCLVKKNNFHLKEQLDYALAQVKINLPNQENYIFNKYYQAIQRKPYSKEELDFIENSPPIRIACSVDLKPISYLNGNKHLTGITIDILKYIEKESGLTFNYLVMPTGKIAHNFILSGQTDFVADVLWSTSNINNSHFVLTNPYLESNLIMVQEKGKTFSADLKLKVAIPENFIMGAKYIETNYPNFIIKKYPTTENCLKALNKGKADLAIQNILIMEDFLTRSKYRNLTIIPQTGVKEYFSLIGSSIADPLLISILNKAISHIPENAVDQYIINNTAAQKKQVTLNYFLEEYGKEIFFTTCILAILLAILNYALEQKKENRRLIKKNKQILNSIVDLTEQKKILQEITAEKERYQITIESSNDIIFDLDFLNQKTMFSNKFAQKFGWEIKEWKSVREIMANRLIHPDDSETIRQLQEEVFTKQIQNSAIRVRIKKADDTYLWCEINLALLYQEKKIARIIGKIVDIDSQLKKYNELEALSQKDDLTGLWNKKTFQAKVEAILNSGYTNCSLIFMDLDNFKLVNDNLGHLIGDECLNHTADKLRLIFNTANDFISRFGGDEFCIFLYDIEEKILRQKAENILQLMQCSYNDKEKEEQRIDISASLGIYFTSKHNLSFKQILEKADQALYEAKNIGKNNIIYKSD